MCLALQPGLPGTVLVEVAPVAVVLLQTSSSLRSFDPCACVPQVQWLTGTDFMPQLLAVLEPGHSTDAAKHAAEVLAAVARSALSPLARCMAEPNFLQTLLERAFEEGGPSSVQVCAQSNSYH